MGTTGPHKTKTRTKTRTKAKAHEPKARAQGRAGVALWWGMREREFLEHIVAHASRRGRSWVTLGPGDDCAEVDLAEVGRALAGVDARRVVVTTDQVVEGVHVVALGATPTADALDAMAHKAVARSVSDIAAMGARPVGCVATACVPRDWPQDALVVLGERLHAHGAWYGCPVVGGDVAAYARGAGGGGGMGPPVVVTVTALGVVHGVIGAVTRAGARPGDEVYVTGALGGSLGSGRHAWCVPRVEEAWWLCESAAAHAARGGRGGGGGGGGGGGVPLRAMMDISDGLGIDADRMARASGVRIEIDAAAVPVHADVDGADGEKWRRAMGDGEDYELLVVADGGWGLPREIGVGVGDGRGEVRRTALTRIGRVVVGGDGVGCVVRTPEGVVVDASGLGYAHG